MLLAKEEHGGDEAEDSGALREHAVRTEPGRADCPGLPGDGLEADQEQNGPGSEGLDATSGAGHQEHQQHPGGTEQQPDRRPGHKSMS